MSQERNRGRFLTDSQVGYLYGNHEPPNKNAEYAMRSKIRSRTVGAFDDFQTLNKHISDDDLKLLFDDWENIDKDIANVKGENRITIPQQISGVMSVIEMAYRGYRTNDMEPDQFVSLVLENAIRKGEAAYQGVDPNKEVVVDLSLEEIETYPDTHDMDPVEKWETGLALTRTEYMEVGKRLQDELDREFDFSEMPELIGKHLVESNE